MLKTMRTLAHIGIPQKSKPANGIYLEDAKLYITDPAESKNNIEFLYFEEECQNKLTDGASITYKYEIDEVEIENAYQVAINSEYVISVYVGGILVLLISCIVPMNGIMKMKVKKMLL